MLYIAGYLNRKTNERYTLCFSCYGLWKIESIDATKDNYIFVKRKQYEHLSSNQGLVFPSELIVQILSNLIFLQQSFLFAVIECFQETRKCNGVGCELVRVSV